MPPPDGWLPPMVDASTALWLMAFSALTSGLTAALGVGGGVLLLAVMAQILPPVVIIPVHGLVQLGSNFNRAWMMRKHIDWRLIALFLPGTLLGAWLASLVLVRLDTTWLQLSIAAFILYLCWGPRLPARALRHTGTFFVAFLATFLGLFVGASGPLVASWVRQKYSSRHETVGTFSVAMSLLHGSKLFVFSAFGFAFHDWLPLVALMITAGVAGTWLGLRWLNRFSDHQFDRWFAVILTVLAVRLIWEALQGN